MAFTEAQRVSIRHYLGWSERFHQTWPRLEQAMNAIDALSDPAAQTKIESILTKLDAIETSITSAYDRLKAMKVGSIELPGDNEVKTLRSEGRRFAGQLAARLGVEVEYDVFGTAPRKAYATAYGLVGRGNLMLQG